MCKATYIGAATHSGPSRHQLKLWKEVGQIPGTPKIYHFLAGQLWENQVTFPNLCFFICEIRIFKELTSPTHPQRAVMKTKVDKAGEMPSPGSLLMVMSTDHGYGLVMVMVIKKGVFLYLNTSHSLPQSQEPLSS